LEVEVDIINLPEKGGKMDFSKLKTYSIKKRKSKVNTTLFAKLLKPKSSFCAFFDSLPNLLKAKELKEIVQAIVDAKRKKRPVLFLMGAHVIKCGLSPLVIELLEKDVVSCIALNGAGVIHDFEIAYCGRTSEDVASAIKDGSFGMARETAEFINTAVNAGAARGWGFGKAIGEKIRRKNLKNKHLSIAYACAKLEKPLTVHVAIGTDIVHQHPSFDGAKTGIASQRDFRILTEEVARLGNGGVVVNIGSAVILPEVFLKALGVARNLTKGITRFTTVNLDMNFHYRPFQNIVKRPVAGDGRGYYMIGPHEIMLPLLTQAVFEAL
jgi:hypothetical protein